MIDETFVPSVLSAAVFGAAAWRGTSLGEALAAGYVPTEGDPPAQRFARWPFVAIGAAIGAASVHGLGLVHLALLALVVCLVAACAAADQRRGMIPDPCSLGALALVLAGSAFEHNWAPAASAALVAIAFGAAATISGGRWLGWGDVKLAVVGGALLGVVDAAFAFMAASFVAYVVALRVGRAKQTVVFGPYLAASIGLALTFQRPV